MMEIQAPGRPRRESDRMRLILSGSPTSTGLSDARATRASRRGTETRGQRRAEIRRLDVVARFDLDAFEGRVGLGGADPNRRSSRQPAWGSPRKIGRAHV